MLAVDRSPLASAVVATAALGDASYSTLEPTVDLNADEKNYV